MNRVKFIVEDVAQTDLKEIYQWYEKGKAGLGEAFLDAFEEALAKIERNQLHASAYNETCRKASLQKFPYDPSS